MWEPYLRAKLPVATEDDLSRLQALAGGPLPSGYWELAMSHQGEALDEELVQDPAFLAFILLLVLPPERLTETEVSYSIEFSVKHVMPRYPAGLLPFADDSGGNLWAFDYRLNANSPSIVFIDHELEGEEALQTVATDFASLLSRIGISLG